MRSDDFHRIVYAASEGAARVASGALTSKGKSGSSGVVRSIEEAGHELLTMYRFPRRQWKTIRTTNVIERLNGEFRRRVKTQGLLPSEGSALIPLFSLVATGQITTLRSIPKLSIDDAGEGLQPSNLRYTSNPKPDRRAVSIPPRSETRL